MKNEMTMTENVADNTEYFAQRQLKRGRWLVAVGGVRGVLCDFG
jgi:ethanolamine permease